MGAVLEVKPVLVKVEQQLQTQLGTAGQRHLLHLRLSSPLNPSLEANAPGRHAER